MRRDLRFLVVTMCTLATSLLAIASDQPTSARKGDPAPSPVIGESWLNHLHRSFGDTSMGKTGRLGPSASEAGYQAAGGQAGLLYASSGQGLAVHGSDLYRWNCQGCHGDAGLGAPPEINSVVNPVRATSVSLVTERMKKTGMEISPAAAAELTKQAQDALLQRLHQGGENMPPFPHLSDVEIRALIEYLKQLAAVPGAKQLSVIESPVRVGEHIVKATCHTCHDATGANPTSQQLENGAIPPLETLTRRKDESQFIQKVTGGAVIVMGMPPSPHRGRMPVFYYLTKDEAADAYLYLTTCPPSQLASAPVVTNVQQDSSDDDPSLGTSGSPASSGPIGQLSPTQSDGTTSWKSIFFLAALASFVLATIAAGLVFGGYELRRLGREAESRREEGTFERDEEQYGRKLVA